MIEEIIKEEDKPVPKFKGKGQQAYSLHFFLSRKPHYKRRKEIFDNIEALKKQLTKNETYSGGKFALKSIRCKAPTANEAECTFSIDQPFTGDDLEWLPDILRKYKELARAEGNFENVGKQLMLDDKKIRFLNERYPPNKVQEIVGRYNREREKLIKELQNYYSAEDFEKKYAEIKHMDFLKGMTLNKLHFSPFNITPQNRKEEEDWLKAMDKVGVSTEEANKLYSLLRT